MPRIIQLPSGNVAWIGKSASDNERLTWAEDNDPEWWWLHAADVPGSHVLLKTDAVTPVDMREAAAWAAHYSKAPETQRHVAVTCTQLKHLRKSKKDPVGMVRIEGPSRTLWAHRPFVVMQ